MLTIKYREYDNYRRDALWKCPDCRVPIKFEHSVPYTCAVCKKQLPSVHLLLSKRNQDDRVKFFMEGKI